MENTKHATHGELEKDVELVSANAIWGSVP